MRKRAGNKTYSYIIRIVIVSILPFGPDLILDDPRKFEWTSEAFSETLSDQRGNGF